MNKKGFTLIELLIVITIIGILAVALLPRLLEGPARARDTARVADLNNLATILQTYNTDNGTFPDDAAATAGVCPVNASKTVTGPIATALVPAYISDVKFPKDPQASNNTLCGGVALPSYWYNSVTDNEVTAGGFILAADVENDKKANVKASSIKALAKLEDYATALSTDKPNIGTASIAGHESVFTTSSR